MALTLVSNPANISNSGTFNITTSLSEDSTHVNLRVRADITVSSVIIASIEKPKGLADFDFSDILDSMVAGISFTRNAGALYNTSGGSPLVSYTVLFTEVWEDASGTTTTGATNTGGGTTYKFVPAKGDGTAFSNYVLSGTSSKFANLTLRNNVTKFYTSVPYEMWLVFFTEVANLQLFYSKDGGAYNSATTFSASGWGAIVINAGGLMSGVTSNLRIQLGQNGGSKISEVITINVDSSTIDERVVLEYDGLIGGKEYLSFEGLELIEFVTERDYYKSSKKARKGISFTGINRQKLETRFQDAGNAEYLKSLLISDTVKRLEPSYATPTDVTVISEGVRIASSDMFTNQIEVEYEY